MRLLSVHELPDLPVSHNPTVRKRVMIDDSTIPNVVFFAQSNFPPGETAVAHTHQDLTEVFFVERGSGLILIDGTWHELRPGTCAVVEVGERHEVTNNGTEDLVLTYLGVRVSRERTGASKES